MPKGSILGNAQYYSDLSKLLDAATSNDELFEAIVNSPFFDKIATTRLDLGIIVLLLVNRKTRMIDRVALSETEFAKGAVRVSAKPFKRIKIPVDHQQNSIAFAIQSGQPQKVGDWSSLFVPALTAQQARFNQSGAGIECSVVHPFKAREGGALIFSYYQPPLNIGTRHERFMKHYVKLVDRALHKTF